MAAEDVSTKFSILLVYARSEPDAAEPLVAVCTSEQEARDVESLVDGRRDGVRVTWEVHDLLPPRVAAGAEVHLVLLDPASHRPDDEPSDPIGIAAFSSREDADREAARRREADGDPHYVVRTLPIGWRRLGWPFSDEDPPPG